MKRHKILSTLLICMLATVMVVPAHAEDFGTFNYWYSDKNTIGFIAPSAQQYNIVSAGTGMTATKLADYAKHAADAWHTGGLSVNFSKTSSSNPTVMFYSKTRDWANQHDFPDTAVGGTTASSKTYKGTAHYNGSTKSVYQYNKVEIDLIYGPFKGGNSTLYSTAQWYNVATHEMGHAIGYDGHASTNYALMFKNTTTKTAPTTSDVNHMKNVYGVNFFDLLGIE